MDRRHHILVADDDDGVRYVATSILQRAAFHVTCAKDGEDAWSALQAAPFDLLITDHSMPRLSGLDLLRRMKAASLAVPVILVSADVPWNEPDINALIRPSLTLTKPFSVVGLLGCVRSALGVTDFVDKKAIDRRAAESAGQERGGDHPLRQRTRER